MLEYCKALNETYVDVSVRPRKEKKMFNEDAFSEAWTNACIHNLWEISEPAIYWYEENGICISRWYTRKII